MKKVLISILVLAVIAVTGSVVYNLCRPKTYVIYNTENVVIFSSNNIYKFYQAEEGLKYRNIEYSVVYNK